MDADTLAEGRRLQKAASTASKYTVEAAEIAVEDWMWDNLPALLAAAEELARLREALRLTEAEQERVDFWKRPAGWGETRDAGVDDLLAIIDRLAALSEKEDR